MKRSWRHGLRLANCWRKTLSDILLLLATLIQAVGALAFVFGVVGLLIEMTSTVTNSMMSRNAMIIAIIGWITYVLGGALSHV